MNKYILAGMVLAVVIFGGVYFSLKTETALGEAGGLPAFVATSTSVVVGDLIGGWGYATTSWGTANSSRLPVLSIPYPNCSARIISTAGDPILLSFDNNASSSQTIGRRHIQASSTTVVYDANQFGCDTVTAKGSAATSTVQITITQ